MTAPRITPEHRISDEQLATHLKWLQRNTEQFNEISFEARAVRDLVDARAELAAKDAEIARLKADQSSYRAGCSCGRSTWQPIETAPKDGTEILAANRHGNRFITQWYTKHYTGEHWFSGRYDDQWGDRPSWDYPVVWMPLIAFPSAAPATPCACFRAGLERAAEIADGVADYYETAAAIGKWDSNKATKARSERDAAKRVAYVIRDERDTRPIVEDAP